MPQTIDPTTITARAIARLVQTGAISAEAVTRAFLDRIDATDAPVQAWTHLDPEGAMEAARAVDRRGRTGALAGVPIGIKDVIDTADMPTGYGSAAYEGFRPAWDAPCVALSRAADAVVLGKTVSTEFAMSSPGKTRNPWNPAHTPGGSSSGSCAAVAAGHVLMAFGTQTSGSIIRPAAFCGIVGYKPSFGTLDRTGIKVLSGSLDTLGLLTRNVRDAAFCTAILAQRPGLAVPDTVAPPRVALFETSRWSQAGPGTRLALERAAEALGRQGVAVAKLPVPAWFDAVVAMQDAVMGWEVMQALAYERLVLAGHLTAVTKAFLTVKAEVTLDQFDAAFAALPGTRQQFDALFAEADVLITPAAPDEAPAGMPTGDPVFNQSWTLLHGPCVTVPAGLGPNGLPVAIQVVGRRGSDARTLAAAAFIEDALGQSGVTRALP